MTRRNANAALAALQGLVELNQRWVNRSRIEVRGVSREHVKLYIDAREVFWGQQ